MAAYVIVVMKVHDRERFKQYQAAVGPTLKPFGGKPVAVEEPAEVLDGDAADTRVVVLSFPSKADARAWKDSANYQRAEPHRLAASHGTIYLLDEMPTG